MLRLLLVLVLGAAGVYAHGQSVFGILPPGISMLPAYANANTAASFAYAFQNNGSAAFTGDLYTFADVNGNGSPQALDTISLVNFQPGAVYLDTVRDYMLYANPGPFVNGRNGIVIWVADDNFAAISDSIGAEILVVCGPAFRLANPSNGLPMNGTLGCPHDFDVAVTNVHETCYKDTLYLNFQANGKPPVRIATDNQVQLPFSLATPVHIQDFAFSEDVFDIGWNDLRVWATGREGCFAADTLGLLLYIMSPTSFDDPAQDKLAVLAWPNPCHDQLQLIGKVPAHTLLELVDATGKTLSIGKWRNHIDLQALQLAAGHYTLRVLMPDKPALHIPLAYLP